MEYVKKGLSPILGKKQLLIRGSEEREGLFMNGGLPYPWAKRPLINLPWESYKKEIFRSSFYYRRAIIPATSYIEGGEEEGVKVSNIFKGSEERILGLGTIFDPFLNKEDQWEESFAILARKPGVVQKKFTIECPLW